MSPMGDLASHWNSAVPPSARIRFPATKVATPNSTSSASLKCTSSGLAFSQSATRSAMLELGGTISNRTPLLEANPVEVDPAEVNPAVGNAATATRASPLGLSFETAPNTRVSVCSTCLLYTSRCV